jgi:catechol 2,3-dioxygenase-like lactoylglutathione lyase family enzyme
VLDQIEQNAHLHHVQINSDNPRVLAEFYSETMGFQVSEFAAGLWLCRAMDRLFLIGEKQDERVLAFGAYQFETEAGLEALKQRAISAGVMPIAPPRTLFGRDAFGLVDPDGNLMVFGCDATISNSSNVKPLNARLQHLVVATDDWRPMVAFYRDVVGMVMSDEVWNDSGDLTSAFLRADQEHHCFAIFLAPEKRLDHLCFETESWNDIRDWADLLTQKNIALQWGPGRHGPGDNLFLFFNDIDGNWLELSAELESKQPGDMAGKWKHEPRTLNLWGMAKMRI